LTVPRPLAQGDSVLSDRDNVQNGTIAATNVRPAFEVSLSFGATPEELERRTGLTRAALADDGATVTGDATYEHMELMFGKPDFGRFLVAAAATHTLASLGVVGLACKTVATLGEAMVCHHRFQHLTNRTASYTSTIDGDHLIFAEQRSGPPRLGNLLVSDYAMLIAAHVVRQSARERPHPIAMESRRAAIADDERRCYEAFLGTRVHAGQPRAALVYDRSVLDLPITSADPELAGFFRAILAKAAGFGDEEDELLRRVRIAIRDALVHGAPEAASIAKALGLGLRTLQRRLGELGTTYADVLESTRRTLAEGYLRDASLGLAEISFLLGYDEQTSFFRAFRRWHDRTPGEYRRAL
jgi:AraC-like DNA-binding protein